MGMLTADENSNILDPKAWKKSSQPVFESDIENGLFGPGHNPLHFQKTIKPT